MKLSGIIIWLLRNTKMPGGKIFGAWNWENQASLWEEFPGVKKSNFLESLQISHNFTGNFNQSNINKKNFNQKLMFFDFIYILTLLLDYRVTDLSGSEREQFLWWTATICTLKKNQHDTVFWWRRHSIVHSFKYTKSDPENERKTQK